MPENNDMQVLVGRTEQLIRAITDAILSSVEVAAERIELAANVARVQQRMAAFSAVLESVGAQKAALAKRLPEATGPAKTLLLQQIAMLATQEIAILAKAGVAEPAAVAAIAAVEATPAAPSVPTHRRDGSHFLRVAPGTSDDRNGTSPDYAEPKDQGDER